MDQLIKKTAIICVEEEDFELLTKFRNVKDVNEFFHVTSLESLEDIDGLTNVIYLNSAKEVSEFAEITKAVNEKGVSQKWQ